MIRLILGAFLIFLQLTVIGQDKYWIFFTDKGEISSYDAADLLSPKALERRANMGIFVDHKDYPVYSPYMDFLKQEGISTRYPSKWLNAVSAFLSPEEVQTLVQYDFIKEIRAITRRTVTSAVNDCPEIEHINTPTRQLSMIGADLLHQQGYIGEGVMIAVFDNGFYQTDQLAAFSHLFEEGRILATKDYVDGDQTLFHPCDHCRHGTYVFSILASKDEENGLFGSAYGASFLLLRTENDASETHQEEDNWVAAAEFADSMGAQVFTTSLGYLNFDPGIEDYQRQDMDGNTAIITIAADIAASKGIVVVNSAGNNGSNGLSAPADGDSVLAIGSVNQCEITSSFSSVGPSFDGRVKPDLAAMGERTFFHNTEGQVLRGNGTSFSCPLVSGLTALMIEANPYASNIQIYNALKKTASQASSPDEFQGYGIPNGVLALEYLESFSTERRLHVFPNPVQNDFQIMLPTGFSFSEARFQILDMMGREISPTRLVNSGKYIEISLPFDVNEGYYIVRIWEKGNQSRPFFQKIVVDKNL